MKKDKKTKEQKSIFWNKVIVTFVFFSLLLAAISISIIMYFAPSEYSDADPNGRIKADYVLMLAQCILGVIAIAIPSMITKKINLEIPYIMITLYTVFLYCAIFLGEVRGFYYNVPHWDTILHTFSGAMLGALGFSIVNFLNKHDDIHINLSPAFVATFALCFAVTLGVIWEIYEFTGDYLMGTNMQKFALESGEQLIGRNALSDTMKDLIVDLIGAFVMCSIGYVSLKYKKGWIDRFILRFKDKKKDA